VVADPSAVQALAVLAAHGEDDWLPHRALFRVNPPRDLPRRARASVSEAAWGCEPSGKLAVVAALLNRHGFGCNAAEAAAELDVCDQTLRRITREGCGRTPTDIIHLGRIAIAALLLCHGIPAARMAPVLGYTATSGFLAAFKRRTGMGTREFVAKSVEATSIGGKGGDS
jgi:AraC-like DNA-binding protein